MLRNRNKDFHALVRKIIQNEEIVFLLPNEMMMSFYYSQYITNTTADIMSFIRRFYSLLEEWSSCFPKFRSNIDLALSYCEDEETLVWILSVTDGCEWKHVVRQFTSSCSESEAKKSLLLCDLYDLKCQRWVNIAEKDTSQRTQADFYILRVYWTLLKTINTLNLLKCAHSKQ